MGNHSDTGEVLEAAYNEKLEEGFYFVSKSLKDANKKAVKLGESPDERESLLNELDPKRKQIMKDSGGRDVIFNLPAPDKDKPIHKRRPPDGIRPPRNKK